jgi:S1-C subfamily serine protease
MSTDQTETDDRPASLDEALAAESAPDIRSLWDGLAPAPPEPITPPPGDFPRDPLADRFLTPPIGAPVPQPSPVVLPDELSPTESLFGPGVRIADPVAAPEAPAVIPDEPAPPTGQEARRQARDAAELERSTRLELRRHRILPRTVIGISMLLLAAALGAALSGAGLYAYYDWRLAVNEDRVGTLTETLETRLTQANEDIANAQTQAVNEIRTAAEPLEQLLADTRTVSDLTPALAPSVFFISTLDEEGAPSVGSGFVVASDESESLIVTSYTTVAAATVTPAPAIEVRGDNGSLDGRLHSWDADQDVALIIVDRGDLPVLEWASEKTRSEALGRRIYVASGLGGAGVSLSPGLVVDQSAVGIQHSAPVGNAWQGGPLLTAEGEVLGIASIAYAPLGFDPGGLPFAVPVERACERVLTCSGGTVTG